MYISMGWIESKTETNKNLWLNSWRETSKSPPSNREPRYSQKYRATILFMLLSYSWLSYFTSRFSCLLIGQGWWEGWLSTADKGWIKTWWADPFWQAEYFICWWVRGQIPSRVRFFVTKTRGDVSLDVSCVGSVTWVTWLLLNSNNLYYIFTEQVEITSCQDSFRNSVHVFVLKGNQLTTFLLNC